MEATQRRPPAAAPAGDAAPVEADRVRKYGPADILWAPHNRAVLLKLARYSVLMAVVPIGVFTLARDLQAPGAKMRDAKSAVAAILALNGIIAAYVIEAFFFEKDPDDAGPQEKVQRLGRWKEERVE
ncbi:hypothetical protein M885DRAFT_529083 [Pelagophyceae sp. CCMP2097]|nr:hypothetical protein M885DRAFT_529083 [Pelagophyceae sp. CCMP2097]|mmetsp:Transcript_26361/g.94006  ORF Transcript_26361/g.94006 Transcript_26361/m.94006 type:complete len:127 (+) Transcript_26361:106-486(+)